VTGAGAVTVTGTVAVAVTGTVAVAVTGTVAVAVTVAHGPSCCESGGAGLRPALARQDLTFGRKSV